MPTLPGDAVDPPADRTESWRDGSSRSVAPHPLFPADGAFYARVLENLPTPVLVLDEYARLVYGNRAASRLGGWTPEEAVGMSTLDHVHPDDIGLVAETFTNIVTTEQGHSFDDDRWGDIDFRMIASDGRVVPLEVIGTGGLSDPAVGGVVYALRPTWGDDLLRRILATIAEGGTLATALTMIVELTSLPPLDIEAVLLETTHVDHRVVAASDDGLFRLFAAHAAPLPWTDVGEHPRAVSVSNIGDAIGARLMADEWSVCWCVSVDETSNPTYRLVALARLRHAPARALALRLERSRELIRLALAHELRHQRREHEATHDALTDLPNRRGFERRFSASVADTDHVGLLYIDLDRFKPVNDDHGHGAGDIVLREVAERLRRILRPGDTVSRLGGDEFAILLPGATDREWLAGIARRVEAEVARPVDVGTGVVTVTASVGIALAPADVDPAELISVADEAMYEIKRAGPHTAP